MCRRPKRSTTLRLRDRRGYQRPRFAEYGEAVRACEVVGYLHAGGTVRAYGRGRERSANHTPAEWRSAAERAHQPDDLSGRGDCLLREPRADTAPGRPHSNRDTLWRGADQARGRVGRDDWRLAGAPQS